MANNDVWKSRIFKLMNDQRGTILRAQACINMEVSGLQAQIGKLEGQEQVPSEAVGGHG